MRYSLRYQTVREAGEIEDKRERAEKVIRQSNNKLKISGNKTKLKIHRAREARQGQARQGQNRQREKPKNGKNKSNGVRTIDAFSRVLVLLYRTSICSFVLLLLKSSSDSHTFLFQTLIYVSQFW